MQEEMARRVQLHPIGSVAPPRQAVRQRQAQQHPPARRQPPSRLPQDVDRRGEVLEGVVHHHQVPTTTHLLKPRATHGRPMRVGEIAGQEGVDALHPPESGEMEQVGQPPHSASHVQHAGVERQPKRTQGQQRAAHAGHGRRLRLRHVGREQPAHRRGLSLPRRGIGELGVQLVAEAVVALPVVRREVVRRVEELNGRASGAGAVGERRAQSQHHLAGGPLIAYGRAAYAAVLLAEGVCGCG